MRLARLGVGIATVAALAWATTSLWLHNATMLRGVPESEMSTVQRLLVPVVRLTAQMLPVVFSVFLLSLMGLLASWTLRVPRGLSVSELPAAAKELSRWIRCSWAVAIVAFGCILGASLAQIRGRFLFFMLLLPFGASYAATMWWAMRVQSTRHNEGRARIAPAVIGMAGLAPILLLPIWPLGLFAFHTVLRSARRDVTS